ncbi:MAG: hypothetical protein HY257_11850 [Chloroflexi bacterium]|nr:hypothetical protein [Chloroflexota bacterium]
MANAATRKRTRATTARREDAKYPAAQYIVDARGKRVAVVLDMEEYRRLLKGKPARMSDAERARLVELARQARGSWKDTEPQGTSVEIVRRLRDEWTRAD